MWQCQLEQKTMHGTSLNLPLMHEWLCGWHVVTSFAYSTEPPNGLFISTANFDFKGNAAANWISPELRVLLLPSDWWPLLVAIKCQLPERSVQDLFNSLVIMASIFANSIGSGHSIKPSQRHFLSHMKNTHTVTNYI